MEYAYKAFCAYVSDCFSAVPASQHYSFGIVDLDRYEPTKKAIQWLWPRITPGGIMALDDFVTYSNIHATLAIKEFLKDKNYWFFLDFFNQQLFLKKVG